MTTAPNRTGRSWTLEVHGARPLTVNRAIDLHRMAWAKATKATRTAWCQQAHDNGVPRLDRAVITVTPLHRNAASPQDVGACAPEAKGAVDGLVDAKVLPDDNPAHLVLLVYTPPEVVGANGLRLLIEELTP
jgi:hypothetical protein